MSEEPRARRPVITLDGPAASGKSIVSTSLGVQGFPLHAGDAVMIAHAPGDFAAAVVALLRDPGRRLYGLKLGRKRVRVFPKKRLAK